MGEMKEDLSSLPVAEAEGGMGEETQGASFGPCSQASPEAPSDLRPLGFDPSRGPSVAQVACEAWRAEKPRHFMNEQAQQKWARVASAIIAAHEAQKESGE